MTSSLRLLLFFCFLFGGILCSPAQPYAFRSLPEDLGISQFSINDMVQDHRGFLWLATWSGLYRYDGYEAKVFPAQIPSNLNGLKSNKITCLYEDGNQQLWVGSWSGGLYQFDRNRDSFVGYFPEEENSNSLVNHSIQAMLEDQQGWLWVATEAGISRLSPDRKQFANIQMGQEMGAELQSDYCYDLKESSDGSIWVGTKKGLYRWKSGHNANRFRFYSLQATPSTIADPLHDFVYRILPSQRDPNTLWIGTKAGLKKMSFSASGEGNHAVQTFSHQPGDPHSLSNNFVTDFFELKKSDSDLLWVATFDGLNLLHTRTGKIRRFLTQESDPTSLRNSNIHRLFLDRTDQLWIGTELGVNILPQFDQPFQNISLASVSHGSNLRTLSRSILSQDLWVGSRGGGLIHVPCDSNGGFSQPLSAHHFKGAAFEPLVDMISDIATSAGELWLATNGGGLIRVKESDISPDQSNILTYRQFVADGSPGSLEDNYLMSILPAETGGAWLGLWDGKLNHYLPETDQFIWCKEVEEQNQGNFPIVVLHQTEVEADSLLWIGTRGGGCLVFRYSLQSDQLSFVGRYQHTEGDSNSLSNDFITDIQDDALGNIWVATESGLNLLQAGREKFQTFYETDGLANNFITSILIPDTASYWLSSHGGLSQLSRIDDSFEIKNYFRSDRARGELFQNNASVFSADGKRMIFGGINSLHAVQPSHIVLDTIPPQVAIVDFRLFNRSVAIGEKVNGAVVLRQSILETKSISLSYEEDVISIGFSGLHFTQPKKLRYAYRLDGLHDDWIYTNAQERVAHFTSLPYRDFTFRVKAANLDGVWSEEARLNISIRPPFWLSWPAYLVYALLFLGLLLGIRQITFIQANLKNKLSLEQVEREKLEEVNHIKGRFFTHISHELRTPLTLILAPLEDFIKDKIGTQSLQQTFVRMYRNGNRLLSMINQVLDLQKNEAGLLKLKVAEGDLIKFTQEITLGFRLLAKQKGLNLSMHTELEKLFVWFDRDQMEKVLFNLIANAIKFSGEGGKIELSLGRNESGTSALIEVKDEGIGIPEAQLPHIFERFFQVDDPQISQAQVGSGLGLALSKSIVEAHHGDISVRSESGQGSCFSICLPLGDQHFSAEEKILHFQNSEHSSHYLAPTLPQAASSSLADQAPALAGIDAEKVLIIEDNADIQAYLQTQLQTDYQVFLADEGKSGLALAIKEQPDLIVSDISMEGMDGIEFCQQVKSHLETSHIPVILLTARTSLIYKIDGLETGADDYVTKPFNMQLLKTRIKNLIQTRKALKTTFASSFDLSPNGLPLNSLDKDFLTKLKTTIQEHLDDQQLSVEMLAEGLKMSRMQLYRKTKALTDQSPNQIIRRIRLTYAAQLLEAGQHNVSEVTYLVGYNDLKSFRTQFKKEFGVSPSAYEGETSK